MKENKVLRLEITIPGELPDLNSHLAANNNNRYRSAGIKKSATNKCMFEVINFMRKNNVPKLTGLYEFQFTWFCPNRKKDPDNICFARKYIFDGMVTAGLLPGDGWKNISGFTDTFKVDAKNPRIEIVMLLVR